MSESIGDVVRPKLNKWVDKGYGRAKHQKTRAKFGLVKKNSIWSMKNSVWSNKTRNLSPPVENVRVGGDVIRPKLNKWVDKRYGRAKNQKTQAKFGLVKKNSIWSKKNRNNCPPVEIVRVGQDVIRSKLHKWIDKGIRMAFVSQKVIRRSE